MSASSSSTISLGRSRRCLRRILPTSPESSGDSPVLQRRTTINKRVTNPIESTESESDREIRIPRMMDAESRAVFTSETEYDSDSAGKDIICPICLGKTYTSQLQGRPDSCSHTFCLECIKTWSRSKATCVLCRSPFSNIKVILRDEVLEILPVEVDPPQLNESDSFLRNNPVCRVCRSSEFEDSMLLCQWCGDAYHAQCLWPRPSSAVRGRWLCPQCQAPTPEDDSDDSYRPEEYVNAPRQRIISRPLWNRLAALRPTRNRLATIRAAMHRR
ncbi:PHD and RING finger domain-containing protein 1 [Galendromus occidentalis]|uniref:PHD and RING finger domain-containing protein 1 n=1 Tax=Galendromus occidentalis TaxID=34638 RepID=A0AAJ6VZN7_9ACAR|nr:PHD and RING finger domain-containing protein 1 [Galendromus occidentalis]